MPQFDLHMHSRHSFDGVMSPAHIVRIARRRNLAGIAVSDHNTIAGGLEAAAANSDPAFLVIVGAEIQTEVGDILGLFLTREIVSRRSMEVVADIHDQGGVAILPHPYAYHQGLTPELLRQLDGIEIYNGRDKHDYSAQTYAEFVQPYGLATLANSDAHLHWEIGRARTELDIDRFDAASVRQAILDRRAKPIPWVEKRSTTAIYGSKIVKRVKRLL